MNDTTAASAPRRKWVRALIMLSMAVAFQLAAWVLLCVAVLQLILSLATDGTNDRLRSFGRSVGRYLAQIADFVSYGTEEAPFPFSDWPAESAGTGSVTRTP